MLRTLLLGCSIFSGKWQETTGIKRCTFRLLWFILKNVFIFLGVTTIQRFSQLHSLRRPRISYLEKSLFLRGYSVISLPFYSLSGSPRLSAQCSHLLTHNPSFHCLNISLTLLSMYPLGLLNLIRVENQNVPLTLKNAMRAKLE